MCNFSSIDNRPASGASKLTVLNLGLIIISYNKLGWYRAFLLSSLQKDESLSDTLSTCRPRCNYVASDCVKANVIYKEGK